jgi:hypothetical protein
MLHFCIGAYSARYYAIEFCLCYFVCLLICVLTPEIRPVVRVGTGIINNMAALERVANVIAY